MKDFLGVIVEVGDTVAFTVANYSQLSVGTIKKLTLKGVRVQYLDDEGENEVVNRLSYQIVKI